MFTYNFNSRHKYLFLFPLLFVFFIVLVYYLSTMKISFQKTVSIPTVSKFQFKNDSYLNDYFIGTFENQSVVSSKQMPQKYSCIIDMYGNIYNAKTKVKIKENQIFLCNKVIQSIDSTRVELNNFYKNTFFKTSIPNQFGIDFDRDIRNVRDVLGFDVRFAQFTDKVIDFVAQTNIFKFNPEHYRLKKIPPQK